MKFEDPPDGVFALYSAGFGQTALDRLGERDSDPKTREALQWSEHGIVALSV